MNSESYICVYEYRYFQLAYLKYWPYDSEGFAFISGRYTITSLQTLENL